jgi:hypothetical protein
VDTHAAALRRRAGFGSSLTLKREEMQDRMKINDAVTVGDERS